MSHLSLKQKSHSLQSTIRTEASQLLLKRDSQGVTSNLSNTLKPSTMASQNEENEQGTMVSQTLVAQKRTPRGVTSMKKIHTIKTTKPPFVCVSTRTDSVRQEKLEQKIDSLTTLVTQLAMKQQKEPMARVCGICTSPDHYSDVCHSLLEPRTTDHPEAYAANIYNNRPNQQQYNPGWRNHPNLKWSDHTQQQPPHAPFQNNNDGHNIPYVPPPIQQQRQQQVINNPPPVPSEPSLEELVRQMTMQKMQFQQETRASIQRQESSIQNLTTQMGQMATSLNTLQSQNSDKLPSQTVINLKNVSAITI
ncbi:hypothetical protein Lal_00026964, partial [Lupinus albus]